MLDPADRLNPAKAKLVSINDSVGQALTHAIDTVWERYPEDEGRRHPNHVTAFRDIELAHENEERVNRDKFAPNQYVRPNTEVTPDNWMDIVGEVRKI